MSLLKVIFWFEWRQFLRQPAQWLIFIFFLFTGIYSLYNGKEFIAQQQSGLDSLNHNQQNHLQELISRYNGDTSTAKGKILAAQAGVPQVVEFRAAPAAANPPSGLAFLAIGQRDLLPYYDIITSKRDIFTPPNSEIANPEKLASGNFDFSFVLIYLFPLLIIILGYDVLSKEKELQTDRLLTVQGTKIRLVLGYKLLFRLFLVCSLAWLLTFLGILMHPAANSLTFTAIFLWWFVETSYLLFWFAVCWLVILLRYSSGVNALILLGCWLTLTLVMPALANEVTEAVHPMPLRAELASQQRQVITETWETPIPELIEIFHRNNPQYIYLRSAADTATYGNKRFAAYYDLLGRRMNSNIRRFNRSIQDHNLLLSRIAWFNPVAQLSGLLHTTAHTGLDDYLYYQQQVSDFQNHWLKFMNGYLLQHKKLTLNELRNLPSFQLKTDESIPARVLFHVSSIWFAILFLLSAARIIASRKQH